MTTANEELRDAVLRHQIGLRRYSAGLMKRIAALLEESDAALSIKLRERLAKFEGKPVDFTSARWKDFITEVREQRAGALSAVRSFVTPELVALAAIEAAKEIAIFTAAAPIEYSFQTVAADQLRAIVSARPFQGRLLRDWFRDLDYLDQRRVVGTLQLGMVNGESTDTIVRKLAGTKAAKFSDGVLAVSRRDATTIVRTATNHVSGVARQYVWDANEDIIDCRIWTATLDGRTSAMCRARDGHGAPIGDKPLPEGIPPLVPKDAKTPGHMNCRSVMVAYFSAIGLVGTRPTVVDIRTRAKREVDFRAQAKREKKPIQEIRKEWAAQAVGKVPAATTYQDFLSRQPAKFQNQVLGRTRGDLFRNGQLKMENFVDRSGNELTLAQLAQSQPQAFIRAGLDPESF